MEAIGERLKRRREELGLTLEQAAEATKSPIEVIVAVEEGRVGIFSAKVYHIAFIRAYARLLKLDADELVRNQKSEEERAQEALRGIRVTPPKTRNLRRTLVMAGAVVALAVVVLVISNRAFQGRRGEAAKPEGVASPSESAGGGRTRKGTAQMVPVEPPPEAARPAAAAAAGQNAAASGLEGQPKPKAPVPDSVAADTTKPAGPAIVPGTNWPIVPASPARAQAGLRTLEIAAHGGA
jgi:cytoskeleton protein RodZ